MTELKTFIFKILNSKYAALTKPASYGTAGFRDIASNLNTICYRVGAFAALLSYKLQGKYCGIMITASHNPIQDNGIKIVEPTGEMLDSSYEKPLEVLINSQSDAEIADAIYKAMPDLKFTTKSRVCLAFDTRPSSPLLCQCAIDGIMTVSGEAFNYKLLTTPELHYMTYISNRDSNISPEKIYYDEFAKAFKDLIKPALKKNYQNELILDCSNGVGSLKLEFYDACSSIFQIKPINFANGENVKLLNNECGADYINIKRVYPRNAAIGKTTKKYAAYDGDADRLIYL